MLIFLAIHPFLRCAGLGFLAWVAALFIVVDAAFGVCYLLLGTQALIINGPNPGVCPVWRYFFFSAHTFSNVVPIGYRANALVFLQPFVGRLMYTLATGLLFARFVKPAAKFRFSSSAVVRTNNKPAVLIRITNLTRSELIQVEASVVVSFFDSASGHTRCYHHLMLERSAISFIPLTWTITHFIDATSPFAGMTEEAFRNAGGEILIQIRAIDQASSQEIHQRASYTSDDLTWHARFAIADIHDERSGLLKVDLERFDATIPLEFDRTTP